MRTTRKKFVTKVPFVALKLILSNSLCLITWFKWVFSEISLCTYCFIYMCALCCPFSGSIFTIFGDYLSRWNMTSGCQLQLQYNEVWILNCQTIPNVRLVTMKIPGTGEINSTIMNPSLCKSLSRALMKGGADQLCSISFRLLLAVPGTVLCLKKVRGINSVGLSVQR